MNFLSLVNDVNVRVNEVPLDEINFASAQGFYAQAKEAINAALREVNQDSFEWPFNHVTHEEPLVAGQVRYAYPANAKTINFDSFRMKADTINNAKASKIYQMDYEEYLEKFVDADYNGVNYKSLPTFVFRAPNFQYGLYPPPKEDQTVVFEYYSVPDALVNWNDVPTFPENFKHVLIDGAMQFVFMFRGDPQSAAVMFEKFKLGVKNMRSIYQNRYEYVRSGQILRAGLRFKGL